MAFFKTKIGFAALVALVFMLAAACTGTKKVERLSEHLPPGMKTVPCEVTGEAFWEHIYATRDGVVLLLGKSGDKLRYYTERVSEGQTPRRWFESYFNKMAEEAIQTGMSGIRFFVPTGSPLHIRDEGATYYVADPEELEFNLASVLCAITPDQSQLFFSADKVMRPRAFLISHGKIFHKAMSGEDRVAMEARIVEEISSKLKAETGSIIERSPASLKLVPEE